MLADAECQRPRISARIRQYSANPACAASTARTAPLDSATSAIQIERNRTRHAEHSGQKGGVAMRIVSLGMQVTLDGFVSGPNNELDWAMERLDEELFAEQEVLLSKSDTMLLGRVNYLDQAAHWPTSTEPIAKILNAMHKVVFSTTLESVDWQNSRLATKSPAEEIAALRTQPGTVISVAGGARLAHSMFAEHLIDELRLYVHPVALGEGIPLFASPMALELTGSRRFGNGTLLNTYRDPLAAGFRRAADS